MTGGFASWGRGSLVGMDVQLEQTWHIGDQIGGGGFGRVFEASSDAMAKAVAKFVPKEPGAERELLLGLDLSGVRNVVPVVDSGEHGEDWVLIMPRADRSLEAYVRDAEGPVPALDAVGILEDVAVALVDIEPPRGAQRHQAQQCALARWRMVPGGLRDLPICGGVHCGGYTEVRDVGSLCSP